MAQLITVRLNKSDHQPLGFRLQGGKDFGTPLVVQKVNGGSAAERAGLQAGDALIRVNNSDVYNLRHQEAQDTIRAAGTTLELTVQRGGSTWRPSVTPTGSLPRPGSRALGATPIPVTNTSLKATSQPSRAFGSGHNNVAKPFGYMNGSDNVKSIVNKQYNTPVKMYSDQTIAETLSAQTEVLAGGVLGVNFKKNEKTYDAEKSAVFKVLQEEQNDPEPEPSHFYSRASVARAGTPCSLHRTHRSRSRTPRVMSTPQPGTTPQPPPMAPRASTGTQTPAPPAEQLAPEPMHRPSLPVGCHQALPDGRVALGAPAQPQPDVGALPVVNDTPYCSECNRYIIGVFVRIKDKNLHVECFKCSTCGTSLKNQGYYNINAKLYCDIHAKLVARQNPPAPNLEPVTVPPGSRVPSNTYSTPLPPLATNNYTNGSSSLFSPSSNLSGPKPFGSSIGSAYSPSLSPRSAPLSPARPVTAPAPYNPSALAPAPAAPYMPAAAPAAPYAPSSGVGAAGRGKTFGVSSAPKRGRGILNKAALPGSRVPLCASCNGNIRGPFITALGRIWCPEHFICTTPSCRRPLQDIGFVEENGLLYCEYCFEQYIAPGCDKCHAKIKGDCLNAIGKHFHPECFNCVYCGKLFGNNPFFLEDGLPYCEADWNELFTTKCFACGFPVEAGDRCARKTSKDRASSQREVDLSASLTPASCPHHQIIYNSDTVYSTSTFRPVSPFLNMPPTGPTHSSPQRTRKLETPLHLDGGLFSDIRSADGKLLSKVTIDRVHSSTRHDVTDEPSVYESTGLNGNKDFVDDLVKTETITNEDVIKVKFTPIPPELDTPRLLTPSQFVQVQTNVVKPTVEYIKDNFEDLQSYKIVSSLYKENKFESGQQNIRERSFDTLSISEPGKRAPSPLANVFVSEQLTKIDNYLQESLNACSTGDNKGRFTPVLGAGETKLETAGTQRSELFEEKRYFYETSSTNTPIDLASQQIGERTSVNRTKPVITNSGTSLQEDVIRRKSTINSVKEKQPGVISAIYNMPIHYHAAILCFLLIVYNLVYQYIKHNCHGNKK
ncbi:PDZ and LIM domain protein Zasp isoform X4 [Hyposmocoma kahamanoa]|uniref:PDZ and LIM domain protein Zasp isoform X4 n=1 Tax=Hyposmocoma kahamanoa TaxID=1477025 RepID=UPI000E6D79F8|nr:PDZ and LIM domain protein Zasp isoform X4 [Hyposmocoma kahamanoa]